MWTYVGKVMSLLFNTLSRSVIAFLSRSKSLLISWLPSPSAVILKTRKIVCHCFPFSPFYLHEMIGSDAMVLVFWMLNFKPVFSLSSFTLIKKLFSPSSLSTIRLVSSAYLRLLIFLPAFLISTYESFSPAFRSFPGASDSKESACSAGDLGSVPSLGRSREGNSCPLQYSCLDNSTDRGAWKATVHGVAKSWTWLSDFHSLISRTPGII